MCLQFKHTKSVSGKKRRKLLSQIKLFFSWGTIGNPEYIFLELEQFKYIFWYCLFLILSLFHKISYLKNNKEEKFKNLTRKFNFIYTNMGNIQFLCKITCLSYISKYFNFNGEVKWLEQKSFLKLGFHSLI